MQFTGPKDPVVHLGGLTGTANGCLQKHTWPSMAMYLAFLGSPRVKLYCSAIKWISVLVQFGLIFTNPVIDF